MVSNEARNNIITLAVLAGFSIMISTFIVTFINNMETTADQVGGQVTKGVDNVTTATYDLVELKKQEIQTFSQGLANLSAVVNKLVKLTENQAETNAANLKTFMAAFKNWTDSTGAAIYDLNHDSNASRAEQTKAFIDTLKQSQNLTKQSLNVTEYRNQLLENQTQQLDQLIHLYNLTINANGTLTMSNGILMAPAMYEKFA